MTDQNTNSGVDSSCQDSEFDQAILDFETSVDRGAPISQEALVRRYPSAAARIREYFEHRRELESVLGRDARQGRPEFINLQSFGHYKVGELVAWGGNASIHKVRDDRFGRDAAIKIPLKRLVSDPRALNRLRREARLSGRLQHPNIVPIYDLGETISSSGGVPYFTMRFVDGRAFSDLLDGRPNPAFDQFRFVNLFRQICEAVAYAHDQGILHRDLKPHNVKVGHFDDAYVMDWGYAKELDLHTAGPTVSPVTIEELLVKVANAESADPEKTVSMPLANAKAPTAESMEALGTPCYLPPEIARLGAVVADRRSDVFCLGGILCAILTGEAPFPGSTLREVLNKSYSANLAETWDRLDQCSSPRELIQLAKDCLAPLPEDRPPNAKSVADRVAEYIHRQEQAKLQAERRARRLTVGLASSVIIFLLALASVWYAFDRDAQRRERNLRESNERRLAEAQSADVADAITAALSAADDGQFERAEAALQRAEGRLGAVASPELRARVATAEELVKTAVNLDEIRQERNALMLDFRHSESSASTKYAAEFAKIKCDPLQANASAAIMASPIKQALLVALDDWATQEQNDDTRVRLLATARAADPDPEWGDRFRDPDVRGSSRKLAALAADARVEKLRISQIQALVDALPIDDPLALTLLKGVEARAPNDFWLNYAMANRLSQRPTDLAGNKSHALEALQYARVAATIQPRSIGALYMITNLLKWAALQDQLDIVAQRAETISGESWLKSDILADRDLIKGAYRSAIRNYQRAVELEPRIGPIAGMGTALQHLNDNDGAIRIAEELLARFPASTDALQLKVLSLCNQKKYAAAQKICVEAAQRDPSNAVIRSLLAIILYDQGRLIDAEKCLSNTDRSDPEFAAMRSMIHLFRGDPEASLSDIGAFLSGTESMEGPLLQHMLLCSLGRFVEANDQYAKAVAQLKSLKKEGESPASWWLGDLSLLAFGDHINHMVDFEKRYGDSKPVPHWSDLSNTLMKNPVFNWRQAMHFGDFFLAKRSFGLSTEAYQFAMSSKSTVWINGTAGLPTNRIRAAIAAAQASIGGGKDALRATDADRARYRKLALGWLKDELDNCQHWVNRGNGFLDQFRSALDGGDSEFANVNVHFMLMHKGLEAVREPSFLEDFPPDDRELAERVWPGIWQLHRQLNPPIDLPF